MRGWLLEHAAGIGLDVFETGVTSADVDDADEVWVSNAAIGVRRVGRVDDRTWGQWPVFDRLKGLAVPAPGWRSPT
jgi:branched-subunit amino acid aminotransferase/4-amino-4-deoxychorismate lyase